MSCRNNCNCNTRPCGCGDTGLTTSCACTSGTANCPELLGINKCAETFSDNCIYHEGDSMVEFGILKGDSLAVILQKMAIWIEQENCINGTWPCQAVLNFQSLIITSTTIKVGWELAGTLDALTLQYSTDNATWIDGVLVNTCYSVTIIVTTLTV
jgi:hypothetical protein